MALAVELRHAGLSAEVDLAGRGLKGQLKHADRIGARRVADPRGRRQRRSCATCGAASSAPVDPGNLVDEMTGGGVVSER